MKLGNKIAIAGVIVALFGIIVTVFLDFKDKADTPSTVEQTTSGYNSPAISNVSGNVSVSTGH